MQRQNLRNGKEVLPFHCDPPCSSGTIRAFVIYPINLRHLAGLFLNPIGSTASFATESAPQRLKREPEKSY